MTLLKLLPDKKIIGLSLIILVSILAGLYFKAGQKPKPTPQVDTANLVKTKAVREEVMVEITPDGALPQTIKMKKGGAVRFLNTDTKPHQIMSDPHPSHALHPVLNTDEVLNKGESVSVMMEKEGNFTYHDHLNPLKIKGTVMVE